MSAIEETKADISVPKVAPKAASPSALTRVLDFLSSVRFGVVLLVLLVIASMIGMLIMQKDLEGFDKYYAEISPASREIFGALGFFDIYHAWYFNALLLILSLNIVLASIDRFPKAWTFISRPKRDASAHWLRGQEQSATLSFKAESRSALAERIEAAFAQAGLKSVVTEKGTKTFVFGQSGVWNRLGAYAVHVALLTIFLGGFMTAQFGVVGTMMLEPGGVADKIDERIVRVEGVDERSLSLPFVVECTDIQQKLIEKEGTIDSSNTLDWLTHIRIKDPVYGEREGLVHLNSPVDFKRGWWWNNYRFFQASFNPMGQARTVTFRATPERAGAQPELLTIKRGGTGQLSDGAFIELGGFYPDFAMNGGEPTTRSREYNNPAARIRVSAGDRREIGYVFEPKRASAGPMVGRPIAGYKFELVDFEKVPAAHILSVQHDPGATVVYVGFTLLGLTLCAVFFFSHRRVWAHVEEKEEGEYEVTLGGNTNRNKLGFEDRFKKIVAALGGQQTAEVKKL